MRRTLLCRLDNAGDVLLTGPAVRAAAAGSDRVLFLAGPRGMEAAAMLPGVDEVMVHRAAWIDPDGQVVERPAIDQLVERVADFAPTDAVVFTSLHQSPLPTALLLRMAGVPSIAAICDDYPGTLLDVRHRIDPNIHEVERNLSLVATLGFRLPSDDDGRLRVLVDSPSLGQVPDTPFVVVHPGASVPARTAPPTAFFEIVGGLIGEGWHVVVTGALSERALTEAVAGRRGGATDLGGKTDLRQLAGVLARASAVVVGNTGPAHLAAGVGTPVVEIYAPTVPAERWRPWAVPHELIGDLEISCAGCRATVCPLPIQLCIAGATPERTVAAVRRVISNRDFLHPSQAVGVVA